MELKPGTYACVKIPYLRKQIFGKSIKVPNIVGWGIRLFTMSPYDHAFLYIGNNQIIESEQQGAQIVSLDKYNAYLKVWNTETIDDATRQEIVNQAKLLVGAPYGFLDLLYLFFARLGLKFDFILKRVESESNLICSQLVSLAGDKAGVNWLCNQPNACLVTPADLANRVKNG